MTVNRAEVTTELPVRDKAVQIRAAIEAEYGPLTAAVAAIVGSIDRGASRDQRAQRVNEVLSDVAFQALAHSDSYQPDRPVVPWLLGIARNVIRSRTRDAA